MRRCLIAQSRSMSKTPRPPSCAYPSSGLIAVRPPYKNTLRSQKSVPLHSTLKKCYAARSIMYIRPMVISFLKAYAGCAFLVTLSFYQSPKKSPFRKNVAIFFAYVKKKLYLRHATLEGDPSKVQSRPAGHTAISGTFFAKGLKPLLLSAIRDAFMQA